MQEAKQPQKPPKKPLIFYYIIAMVVVMLLNALLFPSVMEPQVYEVSSNQFEDMIDNGQVSLVALDEDSREIVFIARDESGQERY